MVYGLSSEHALAEQGLGDRRRQRLGDGGELLPRAERAAAGQDADAAAGVEDRGGAVEARPRGHQHGCRDDRAGIARQAGGAPSGADCRSSGMARWTGAAVARAVRQACCIARSAWPGPITRTLEAQASASTRSRSTSCWQSRADQVVRRQAGERQHRRAIQPRVVEAAQQQQAAGPAVARQTPSRPVTLA